MTKMQQIHEAVLHLRADAWQAEMPGYAEKMLHAAGELERRAVELEKARRRGKSGQQMPARETSSSFVKSY